MKQFFAFLMLCSGCALAQNPPASSPPNQQAPMVRPQREMESPMERVMQMREQRMMQMNAQELQQMRTAIDAMRRKAAMLASEANAIQDTNTRHYAETNAELWQALIDGLSNHVNRMQQMQGPMPGVTPPQQLPKTTPPKAAPQNPHP